MVTTDSDGTIVKYVYGNGLISSYETKANTTEYQSYSYDLRGSVTSVSDENGTVIAEYSYSTYGERTVIEGEETVLDYCARDGVLTETNGLIYMRARYYCTELMRFINEDIITGDISNSNSLNRYAYVEGNPATNVDPFGLCVEFVKKNGHTILDILGFVPGYGEVFDVANGVYYAKEGNVKYAILSFASIVPIVGDVIGKGGKYSSKAVKLVANSDEIEKIVKLAAKGSDDVVKVGSEVAEAVVKYSDDAADAINNINKSSSLTSELFERFPEFTGSTRDMLLAKIQNTKLSSIANELYRPGAVVGDGGTADKLIQEFYDGLSTHLTKAEQRLKGIDKLISSGDLGLEDLDIAEALRDDLEYAINLFNRR